MKKLRFRHDVIALFCCLFKLGWPGIFSDTQECQSLGYRTDDLKICCLGEFSKCRFFGRRKAGVCRILCKRTFGRRLPTCLESQ
jgi:hypothetical protein